MNIEGTQGTPAARRITVEDVDRALDFIVALTVHLTHEPQPSLEHMMHMSREQRDLYLAPEAYRPNQEMDVRLQELRHVTQLLNALSEGTFLIPDHESPWEDWDGEPPASVRTLLRPAREACAEVAEEPPRDSQSS